MATFEVKVRVDYFYEVEADSLEEAEEQGWQYEDYRGFADVYSIDITQISDDEEEDEDDE